MDKTAFIIYLVVLILGPLLFGAVHTYAYTIMSLGVLTATLLLVIKNIKKDSEGGAYQFQFPNTSLNFAFFLLLVFLIFQVIPLPDSFIEFLSPEAKVIGEKSSPASIAVVPDSQPRNWFTLSIYYYPVRMSIVRFSVYGLFFLGLTQVLNSQKRIEVTIFLILMTGCFEALYGLMQTYSGSGRIWWFKSVADPEAVTGTYINRNHFAGLMEMGLLLAASYAAALSERKRQRNRVRDPKRSFRAWISPSLPSEQLFNKRTSILFAGVVMGLGLVFSASRGGIISAAVGMLCMSLLFVFKKNHRRNGFILLFLFLITSAYALHIGVEYPLGRFGSFYSSFEERSRLAQRTMNMFGDYKLTGTGVGNFQYAYSKYQSPEDKDVFVRHAHNDWAQFLAEAGITGFCLLFGGIFCFFYRTTRLWKKRRDPFAISLGAAPMAAMAAVAIHSISDFNLHIPANFLMLVAMIAIGYSALHLKRHKGRDKTLYRYYIIPLRHKGILVLFLILGLVFWNGYWTIRHFMAEVYCNTVHNSTLNRDQNPSVGEIKKAILWDSWNAQYWYKLARELTRIQNAEFGVANDEERYGKQLEIIRALEEAVHLNPFQGNYHLRLGWAYTYLWQDPVYRKKWLPAADLSMERAAYFAGEKNPRLHVTIGNYWIWRSKTTHPIDPEWEIAWAKACRHYKKAQSLEGGKSLRNEIEKFVWKFYPDRGMVEEVQFSGMP